MGKVELKLEVDADLLAQAQAAGLNPSAILEDALRGSLPANGMAETATAPDFSPRPLTDDEKARRWAEENAEAIKAHRERIEQYGVFGEDLRTW